MSPRRWGQQANEDTEMLGLRDDLLDADRCDVKRGDIGQEQGGFEVFGAYPQWRSAMKPTISVTAASIIGRSASCSRRSEPAHVFTEGSNVEMGPIAFRRSTEQKPIPPGGTVVKRKWLTPMTTSIVDRRSHHHELGYRAERDQIRRLFGLCSVAAAAWRGLLHS